MTYVGAAWRSRYLGAPKYAHELASQPGFCPLSEVAEVWLGLKTGCDDFFFVKPAAGDVDVNFFSGRSRRARLKGLKGWEGDIENRDLRPAALNPHQLFSANGERVFAMPLGEALYVYPRDRTPTGDLGVYVGYAEREGVHERPLVRQNGSATRWYRQTRASRVPTWALPYNSAYDFGAWDNRHHLTINGRFVGVAARGEVDNDLLGAVLNTTMVMLMRLMEGTATGVEAAYDVGPPAARRVLVPDPREFRAERVEHVRDVLAELRAANVLPPAPDEHGAVDPLRRRLDGEVLRALGYSAGQAAVVTGHCYESYARWRTTIRQMQVQMEAHRRQMNRTGVSRGADPLRRTGQQLFEELQIGFPVFPASGLRPTDAFVAYDLDPTWRPGHDEPMFDAGLARVRSGATIDVGGWNQARYAGMLLDVGFRPPIDVLTDGGRAGAVVETYEATRGALSRAAGERAAVYAGADAEVVVGYVLAHWRHACRRSGMGTVEGA